jgi:hypothetical protein
LATNPRVRFVNILKGEGFRSLVLMKRSGWNDPAEVLPRRWIWGYGGVDVFSFSRKIVLGLATHVFDDVEWGSDAC